MSDDLQRLVTLLGLRAQGDPLRELLAHLTHSQATPTQVMERWLLLERHEREARNLESRTRNARVGTTKALADFDWRYSQSIDEALYEELLRLDFLTSGCNVLFRGAPGVGKTTLAKNLALRALERGHTVLFANLSSALADLLRQDTLPALERRLRRYTRVDMLVLDELGYQPADVRAVNLLFQVISRRHERASTIITTNLCFKEWPTVFPGAACLTPLVDRFTERLVTFDIGGPSYRQRDNPLVKAAR